MNVDNFDLKGAYDELSGYADSLSALDPASIDSFDSSSTVFVMVDIVNGFINEGAMASPDIGRIIPPICGLLKKCTAKGIPSVAFADCHSENCEEFYNFPVHCLKGSSESEIVDEIKKIGGYTLICKNSTNGFHEKKFREYLSEKSTVNNFIVVGDCTDICVMQFCLALKTYFTVNNRRCRIVVPLNCVDTYNGQGHNSTFANLAAIRIMTVNGIEFAGEII